MNKPPQPKRLNAGQREIIEILNGSEFEYGDTIVLIDGLKLIECGLVYEYINQSNFDRIMEAYKMDEYGTTDSNEILKIEGLI